MGGTRTRLLIAAVTAGAAVWAAVAVGPPAVRAFVHRPDPVAFRQYVDTYAPAGDRTWMARHRNLVDAEAERACAWLDTRPTPPTSVDPSGRFAVDTLMNAYLATPASSSFGPSGDGRSTVLAGAWNYLCWSSMKAHAAPRHGREATIGQD